MQRWALVLTLGAMSAGCGGSTPRPIPDGGGGSDSMDVGAPTDTADAPVAVDAPGDASDAPVVVDAPGDVVDAPVVIDASPDAPDGSVLGPWNEIHPCAIIGGDVFAGAAFSANGSLLALGGTAPRIYSVGASSLTLVRSFVGLAGPAASVALSPDGTMIAAGANIYSAGAGAGVAVWRVADGSLVWTRPAKHDGRWK